MAKSHSDALPPLKVPVQPLVSAQTLLAVDEVHLPAGDVPRAALRDFYEKILGLTFIPPESAAAENALHFAYLRRRVILERPTAHHTHPASAVSPEPRRLGLLIRDFSDTLLRLRDRNIPYELLHTDAGLTRTAILKDPAGNWIHLIETRPF